MYPQILLLSLQLSTPLLHYNVIQVSSLTRVRDKRTESPGATPPPPQPSTEQANIIRRLRASRDPWSQLGLTRGCGKEEVNRSYRLRHQNIFSISYFIRRFFFIRKLAVLLHPDKTEVAGAQEAFKILGQARNLILKTYIE